MHAATVTTARPRGDPLWIMGPWQDLIFLVGTPLLLLASLSLARVHWGWASIAAFALIWSIGHHLPGMLRAYADPRLFQRFPLRFVVAPLFLLSVASASFVWSLSGLFLVTIVWGWWHYLMQIYGFVRIYDAKMGPSVALTRRLDRAMCIAWFAAAVLLSDTPLYGYLDRLAACGVSLPPTEWFVSLRHVTLAALVVVTALFAANLVRLGCHGQAPNPWKLALMASAFAYFWYCNATFIANLRSRPTRMKQACAVYARSHLRGSKTNGVPIDTTRFPAANGHRLRFGKLPGRDDGNRCRAAGHGSIHAAICDLQRNIRGLAL